MTPFFSSTFISAFQPATAFLVIVVVVIEVVDTPEEAIAAANRTMYGLTSSILAGDTYKAFEMAPKILAGIVNVNSPTVNDEIHAPMGGVRDSGWGRTGPRSLDDFSDVILIIAQQSTTVSLLIFKAAMGDIKAQALGDSK